MSEPFLFDALPSDDPELVRKFRQYHADNPAIYRMFRRFAFEAIYSGREHYSAKGIFERMRWETMVSGDDGFKLNNNYTAFYARMFMNENPVHDGFFRLRSSIAEAA